MTTLTASLMECWRKRGEALPLTVEAFDDFNREIQVSILEFEGALPALAVGLAQVKLEINKRIYDAQRQA